MRSIIKLEMQHIVDMLEGKNLTVVEVGLGGEKRRYEIVSPLEQKIILTPGELRALKYSIRSDAQQEVFDLLQRASEKAQVEVRGFIVRDGIKPDENRDAE